MYGAPAALGAFPDPARVLAAAAPESCCVVLEDDDFVVAAVVINREFFAVLIEGDIMVTLIDISRQAPFRLLIGGEQVDA